MEIEAYILIGGKSARFGRDKATFELDGETLGERSARIAETSLATKAAVYVAAAIDQFPHLGDRKVIVDTYPNRGPAGAIHSALSVAVTPWVFALAVDLPFVSVELISNLKSEISDSLDVVVPVQQEGVPQPLCAFYRAAACREAFREAVKKEGKLPSIREIIGTLHTRYVEFDEYSHLPGCERLLRNVNTLEDLENI